jgi:hypothetical protein
MTVIGLIKSYEKIGAVAGGRVGVAVFFLATVKENEYLSKFPKPSRS